MRKVYSKKSGFSLIELVITIAIMAVMVGVVSLSFVLLRSTDTKGLASGINDSLTDLKAITESHAGPYYLHIYQAEGSFYATYSDEELFEIPDVPTGTKLGPNSLTVTYTTESSDEVTIEDDKSATVMIQKKDGAYKICPEYFDIYNGTEREYRVILTKDTGLHFFEKL